MRLGSVARSGWLALSRKPPQPSLWRSRLEDRSIRPLVGSRRILLRPAASECSCTPSPRSMWVDHVVLVTDDEIKRAQRALWETLRVVAEPGGAAAFAALLSGRYQPRPAEHVGVLLSGGNTTAVNFG